VFDHFATIGDRFARMDQWYAKGSFTFKEGTSLWTFFPWLIKQF
jgi:hypothetical protein